MTEVRCRFAPSPTGHLHIGGARTALFCFLYAKRHSGKFILRIDDTDRERSTKEMEEAILNGLKWLGLQWDEGPYYQSRRMDVYENAINKLWESGHLYRCNCSSEVLEEKRKAALAEGRKPRYDGACRDRTDISPDEPHVLRFRSPQAGETVIEDGIQGKVTFPNAELDDLILRRTDGSFTYNFTTVVDDVDLRITHVIRGVDHLNNTHRQAPIFKALGSEPPVFAHMALTLGPDKTKLSKRHGDTALLAYRDKGYLPEAMVNYMVRLGWGHGDREIFTMQELIELFDLDGCTKSPGVFDIRKLNWVDEQHMQKRDPAELAELMAPFLKKHGIEIEQGDPRLPHIVETLQARSNTLDRMAESARIYFFAPGEYDEKAAKKFLKKDAAEVLRAVQSKLPESELDKEVAITIVRGVAGEMGVKLGAVAQPIRVALTGSSASPPIDDVMSILGPDEIKARFEKAIDFIKKSD